MKHLFLFFALISSLVFTPAAFGRLPYQVYQMASVNNVPIWASVTQSSLGAPGQQISTTSGSGAGSTTTSGTFGTITNQSVTITTHGRPVLLTVQADGTTNTGTLACFSASATQCDAAFQWQRDSSTIYTTVVNTNVGGNGANVLQIDVPPGAMNMVDFAATAGSHTYILQFRAVAGTASARNIVIIAFEI